MQKLLILIAAILVTGCKTIDSRGQYVDDEQILKLESKNLTKEEVVDLIGSPSMTPDYTSNTWYYAHRTMARRAWFKPEVVSQRLIRITFSHDKIQEVEVFNDSHANDVHVVQEYTKSLGNEQNPLQHFVKNFGRFNKPPKKPKKKQ